MSWDPADLLALAAAATVAPRRPSFRWVMVPAPFHRRLIAVMIDAALVFVACGFFAIVVTMGVWAPVFGEGDFDGPPQLEALGAWFFLATWSALALVYMGLEALGWRTLGKLVARLHLSAAKGQPRRRLFVRWFIAYCPLLALTFAYGLGAAHTLVLGWEAFDSYGRRAEELMLPVVTPLAVLWALGFAPAARGQRQTLAEQVAGVELQYVFPPTAARAPGFEVIPAPRPVLPA